LAAGPVAGDNNDVIALTGDSTVLGAGISSYVGNLVVGNVTGGVGHLHGLALTAARSDAVMPSAASVDRYCL
jgi:hypothetical protein